MPGRDPDASAFPVVGGQKVPNALLLVLLARCLSLNPGGAAPALGHPGGGGRADNRQADTRDLRRMIPRCWLLGIIASEHWKGRANYIMGQKHGGSTEHVICRHLCAESFPFMIRETTISLHTE